MNRKYNTWRVLHPNGELETVQVPVAFDAEEMAKKYRHSEVFMKVPARCEVSAHGSQTGWAVGPCWVYWDRANSEWVLCIEPKDEASASNIVLEVVNMAVREGRGWKAPQ